MKYLQFLFICLLYCLSINGEQLVKIEQGLIEGTTMKTRNGREISIFLGIPYAEPPIGKRRFSNPIPAKKWNGIRLANREGNFCPQIEINGLIGEEDCLYLNVFTPQINFNKSKQISKNDLLPVMVRIHGGGFLVGSSNFTYYGPNYLLDREIILVSINYRLGILGFFATKDSVVPGNFGLKDQVLALKWIKRNIKYFGGDANRVTLFGESAGGACVGFHAISDASNGLFHQYIFQSGSVLGPWAFRSRRNLDPYVKQLIKNVNCPDGNSTIILNCLQEKSIFQLLNAVPYDGFNFSKLAWIPTDEIESKEAFLTDTPMNLIRQNKMKDYPSMSGNVGDEGLPVTLSFYASGKNYQSMLLALEKYINSTAYHYMESNNVEKFSKIIHNFYFNESLSADRDQMRASFTKFVSDCRFNYPQVMLIENMKKFIKSPFYLYLFNYRGNESVVSLENGIKGNVGVTHGEELLYHFAKVPLSEAAKVDQRMIDIMVDLWTSFAINGEPKSDLLPTTDLWQPYMRNASFLQIGNPANNNDPSITLNQDFFNDRMNFWKENFPHPVNSGLPQIFNFIFP